jgi:cellulose synthase/poly-beta-1,6-N-acetylglucosamine synthase-like glycosyltransferase
MKVIFWSSLLFIIYTYIGYPLWLALKKFFISPLCFLEEKKIEFFHVSIIIAAYNEENIICSRIYDINKQNFPNDKIEIFVVSDGSTDQTCSMLKELTIPNLKIIELPLNQGKAVALNKGVHEAKGEIVVFTDARQTFAPNAIQNLCDSFSDPKVGCVSGELMFLQDGESTIQAEMGAYWKYEKWIRKAESVSGSTVGATGAIYAIRKKLYRPLLPGTILDDVLTPINIAVQGYRCLFNSKAVAYDVISENISQEWKRKVRTLAGNWQLLSLAPFLLLPSKNPLWWRFLSHKIFRLLVPLALLLLLGGGMIAEGMLYRIFSVLHLLIYIVALMAWQLPRLRKNRLINFIFYFVTMNIAAVAGFWKWVNGFGDTIWVSAYKSGQ